MKTKYTIQTQIGEVTRTSHREYTHVVVAKGITREHVASWVARERAHAIHKINAIEGDPRYRDNGWQLDNLRCWRRLAEMDTDKEFERTKDSTIWSFCGRADLAMKTANKLRDDGWNAIEIIELKPEHKRIIQPRRRSA
jgi:hypothetical protein